MYFTYLFSSYFQTAVRSCLLGSIFASGVFVLINWGHPWNVVGWYLCILSIFHFSEFLSIAWCNTSTLSVSSFILNHSREYWVAMAASWMEFVVEVYFFPGKILYQPTPIIIYGYFRERIDVYLQ